MNDVRGAVRAKSFEQDGKIKLACKNAFALAEEQGVTIAEIGRICEEENIRICGCQLGCF